MSGEITEKKKYKILGSTLVFSILVHSLILMQMTGIFKETSFIELSLKQEFKPSVRNIPNPPTINKKRILAKTVNPSPSLPYIPKPLPLINKPLFRPDNIIRPSTDPSEPKTISQTMPEPEARTKIRTNTGSNFNSPKDYFQMVRQKIEKNKKYPKTAIHQNITGNVTLKFIIKKNGSITGLKIVKKSKFRSLNRAALEAIKACVPFPQPPRNYFKNPLPIQLTIVFEFPGSA